MVQLGATLPADSTSPAGPAAPVPVAAGSVRRRRTLPGGRAVVGGLLVALAAVGVFVSWSAAAAGPTTTYVVASRDLGVGERLVPGDVRLVTLDLPDAQRSRAFTAPGVLEGAVALAPLAEGELVQASAVAKPEGGAGTAQVSFAVEASHALGGRVKPGERVDLVAVYGSGATATVERAAEDAVVVDVDVDGGPVGGGLVTLTVAVAPEGVEAVALASSAGTLKVVRTTNLVGA